MRSRARSDDGGVPAQLLAQRHRRGVHQVGTAGLHGVGELDALGAQRVMQRGDAVEQVAGAEHGRDMDGRGKGVVGGLGGVDVVVGVHLDALLWRGWR